MTTLFSDGFESGDFSAWSAHIADTNEAIAVTTDSKNNGTYGCKVTIVGGDSGQANAIKAPFASLAANHKTYAATWFRVTSAGTVPNASLLSIFAFVRNQLYYNAANLRSNPDHRHMGLRLRTTGSNFQLQGYYWGKDSASHDFGSPFTVTLNTWYMLVIAVDRSGANPVVSWWTSTNGTSFTQQATHTAVESGAGDDYDVATGDPEGLFFGADACFLAEAFTLNFDDASVTDFDPTNVGPVISSVQVDPASLCAIGAAVVWATDVASDSQVEYGPTSSYGSSTTLNTTLSTSHGAVITGRSPSTTTHYLPHSKNAGAVASNYSTDNTFTTPARVNREVWGAGDSKMYGQGLADNGSPTTGAYLSQVLALAQHGTLRMHNKGIGGSNSVDWDTGGSSFLANIILPFAGASLIQNILILSLGHNDVGSAATTYGHLGNMIDAAHMAGFQVIILTQTPGEQYIALNALIVANARGADAVLDIAADSRLYTASDTTYFQDGSHETSAGHTVIADMLQPVLDYLGTGSISSFQPDHVVGSQAGTLVRVVGSGTDWWDGMDFTATGGTITETRILSATEALLTITPPASGAFSVSDQWLQTTDLTAVNPSGGGGGGTGGSGHMGLGL